MQIRQGHRLALAALCAALAAAVPAPAVAQCRAEASSPLPMPAATWLRSWRADLAAPTRLALDADGRVLVSDPARGSVVARQTDGALAFVRRDLGRPTAIAVDADGNHLVGDGEAGRVRVYDRDWNPRHALGVGDGEFGQPGDIVVDAANGEIYVADTARHVVAVYAASGLRLRVVGTPAPNDDSPPADGQFRAPTGIAIAGDELLVADQLNYRIQVFDKASGAYRHCLGTFRASSFFSPASGPARTFGMVQGLWVDTLGRLYVADAYQGQVRVIDRGNGALIGTLGTLGAEAGALSVPSDLLIDRHGRLVVASTDNARLDFYGLDAYTDPEAVAPAAVRLSPAAIPRLSPAGSVEAAIEVPGYRAIDIDPASLRINGLAATALGIEDRDGNGIPELRAVVSATRLLPTLGGESPAPVTVSGRLGALRFTEVAELALVGPAAGDDADRDGVADALDACPGTAAGVPVTPQGCSAAQLCPCAARENGRRDDDAHANGRARHDGRQAAQDEAGHDRRHEARPAARRPHGEHVRCVRGAADAMRQAGRVTQREYAALVREAAKSACGRRR